MRVVNVLLYGFFGLTAVFLLLSIIYAIIGSSELSQIKTFGTCKFVNYPTVAYAKCYGPGTIGPNSIYIANGTAEVTKFNCASTNPLMFLGSTNCTAEDYTFSCICNINVKIQKITSVKQNIKNKLEYNLPIAQWPVFAILTIVFFIMFSMTYLYKIKIQQPEPDRRPLLIQIVAGPQIPFGGKQFVAKSKHTKYDCSICLDEIVVGDKCTELYCKHIFHTNCISTWANVGTSCPNCRQQISRFIL